MESRFLRLADLVVQRMPWSLEELEVLSGTAFVDHGRSIFLGSAAQTVEWFIELHDFKIIQINSNIFKCMPCYRTLLMLAFDSDNSIPSFK